MRHPLSLSLIVLCGAALTTAACVQPEYPDELDDTFEGLQSDGAVAASAPDAGPTQPLGTQQNPALTNPATRDADMPTVSATDAGSVMIDVRTGPLDSGTRRDAEVARIDAGSTSTPDAGSGMSSEGSLSRCTITASTDASDTLFYAGKYGCAVWISGPSNKLVKAFFLATRIANRSGVPTYRSESSGMTVDVVAGATLNAPKQHQYTWMLTDTQGMKVPPGKYALKVEVHSSNGVALLSVPFDTSAGPVSEDGAMGQIRSAKIDCQ